MYFPGRREALFAALYFCEGAPIGFVWWALPAYWASTGVSGERITTIVAVAVLPWTLKWLWAPLVDLAAPRIGYRPWIIAAQVAMGLSLVPLAWLDPQHQLVWLLAVLVVHAISAATQDVAIDGLCVATVAERERGEVNGWMQAGMLLGRALFGGGAVLLMAQATLVSGVALLVAILWTAALWLAVRPPRLAEEAALANQAVRRVFTIPWDILRSRRVWLAVVFALTGGAAFESVGALLGPYLRASELTLTHMGLFQIGPLSAAMAAGALVGGRMADRFGHVRVAWLSGSGLVGLNAALAAATVFWPEVTEPRLGVITCQYVVIGIFTASTYALFMDLAAGRWQATLFSALMGATNACEAGSAYLAGRLAADFGFSATFIMMTVPTLLGLAILPFLQRRT